MALLSLEEINIVFNPLHAASCVKGKNIYLVNNPISIKKGNIIKRPQDGIFKILSIGRLEEEKNLFMLLHALNKINGKWKDTIIGDGSKRKVLESAAEIL